MGLKYLIIQQHMIRSSMTLKWRSRSRSRHMCCDLPWLFIKCFFFWQSHNSYNILIKIILHFHANNISSNNTIGDQPEHTHNICTFLFCLTYNRKTECNILNNSKTWLMAVIHISIYHWTLPWKMHLFFNCTCIYSWITYSKCIM